MMTPVQTNFAAFVSVAVSVGISAVPSLLKALRKKTPACKADEVTVEAGNPVPDDKGSDEEQKDEITREEIMSELENSDVLVHSYCGSTKLQSDNSATNNLCNKFCQSDVIQKGIFEGCSNSVDKSRMPGIFQRGFSLQGMESNDCAEMTCDRSGTEMSVREALLCISQGTPLSSSQIDNNRDHFDHHDVAGLNSDHNNDSEHQYEASEEPERCTVVPAAEFKLIVPSDSSGLNDPASGSSIFTNPDTEEIDITCGSGELYNYRKFRRFLYANMDMFFIGFNSVEPRVGFLNRQDMEEWLHCIVLETTTSDSSVCGITVSHDRNFNVEITVSLPLEFFHRIGRIQNKCIVNQDEGQLSLFFEVFLDCLLCV